ncbi:hypothetical protein HQ394_18180 [Defluviicoccus vanus]|uniref:10 kDa chaperonin n=1 Tax=Defluviicoccus vanus TaxID=111831 RepID=A0A7H1N5A3_9PROT|nr:hypothetical protein HQ394_18180 [Defluviicoccus vanus]
MVAVGQGARGEDGERIPLEVRTGDPVLFGKWSGSEVKIDGREFLITIEPDLFGIIEG